MWLISFDRVTYILQHGELDRNALFLLNFAFHVGTWLRFTSNVVGLDMNLFSSSHRS